VESEIVDTLIYVFELLTVEFVVVVSEEGEGVKYLILALRSYLAGTFTEP
jgi:hypothetical protein